MVVNAASVDEYLSQKLERSWSNKSLAEIVSVEEIADLIRESTWELHMNQLLVFPLTAL